MQSSPAPLPTEPRPTAALPGGAWLPAFIEARQLVADRRDLPHALELLEYVQTADPRNPVAPHVLALALILTGEPAAAQRATALWRKHGLPHDRDLLGEAAMAMELAMRPVPDAVQLLPAPAAEMPSGEAAPEAGAQESLPAAPTERRPGWSAQREARRGAAELEQLLMQQDYVALQALADSLLARGLEIPDIHLAAGMAAGESGNLSRARQHLLRCAELEPAQLMARTLLGRVYWREGRYDLALALWRSLPVEGPYDHGRHYHLALGYAALGDQASARAAMELALSDFFYDTRHIFIRRAWDLWQSAQDRLQPEAPARLDD